MSTDELLRLHEKVTATLAAKMIAEKSVLENRLAELNRRSQAEHFGGGKSGRRSYPPVLPKFRNPDRPSETWSGRGKQPRWLTAQLRSGKRIEDFLIKHAARRINGNPSPVSLT